MRKFLNIKMMLFLFLGQMVFSVPVFAAPPPTMDDVKKELSEAMDAIRAYSENQKAEAVKGMQTALEKMDEEIASLSDKIQKQWEKQEPEAREKARETLDRLRRLRDRMAASVEEWKAGGKITWKKLKEDFLKAWKEFQESFEDADRTYDRPTVYL